MNANNVYSHCLLALMVLFSSACCRSGGMIWEDTKTASQCFKDGFCTLWSGNQPPPTALSREDFYGQATASTQEEEEEFLVLEQGQSLRKATTTFTKNPTTVTQKTTPEPVLQTAYVHAFRNIEFDFDSSKVKNKEDLQTVQKIATYLKEHKKSHLTIEGHTDERGPQAYNLSLGAKRAASIAKILRELGIPSSQISTISYGKEKPLFREHDEQSWQKNRRAEFKLRDSLSDHSKVARS